MSTIAIIELTAATVTFTVLAAASYLYAHREGKKVVRHDSAYVVE